MRHTYERKISNSYNKIESLRKFLESVNLIPINPQIVEEEKSKILDKIAKIQEDKISFLEKRSQLSKDLVKLINFQTHNQKRIIVFEIMLVLLSVLLMTKIVGIHTLINNKFGIFDWIIDNPALSAILEMFFLEIIVFHSLVFIFSIMLDWISSIAILKVLATVMVIIFILSLLSLSLILMV